LLERQRSKSLEGTQIRLFENQGFERKSGPISAEHYVSAGVHFGGQWVLNVDSERRS
jgi:hypothetical protein